MAKRYYIKGEEDLAKKYYPHQGQEMTKIWPRVTYYSSLRMTKIWPRDTILVNDDENMAKRYYPRYDDENKAQRYYPR